MKKVNLYNNAQLQLNKLYTNKIYIIGIFFIILLFSIILYFLYNRFIKSKLNNHELNKEFINQSEGSNDTNVYIMYFYTEWCPYCKRARPEINKFETYLNNINNTNDNKFKIIRIDCDKNPEKAEKYNVKGYPTIIMLYKGEKYEYDAKPEKDNLIKFVNSFIKIE